MMTKDELIELFDKHNDLYLQDEEGKEPPANLQLHAVNILQSLLPETRYISDGADNEIIYLAYNIDNLCNVITEEQVIELLRCGIRYNSEHDCLSVFV